MTTTSKCGRPGALPPPWRSRSPPCAWRTARRRRPATMSWSRLSTTSRAKSTPVPAAIARTSSCTGLPSVTPQRASGWPIRRASCSVSTVSRPARPGRDHLRAAGEAGEEVRLDEPGGDLHVGRAPLPVEPDRNAVAERADPLQGRVVPGVVVDDADPVDGLAPNISTSSSRVLARWVPVATSTVTSSGRTIPSSSSSTAGIISCRGCGLVPSQAEIATVWPGLTCSRSGGPATGSRSARAARPSGRPRPAGAPARRSPPRPGSRSPVRPGRTRVAPSCRQPSAHPVPAATPVRSAAHPGAQRSPAPGGPMPLLCAAAQRRGRRVGDVPAPSGARSGPGTATSLLHAAAQRRALATPGGSGGTRGGVTTSVLREPGQRRSGPGAMSRASRGDCRVRVTRGGATTSLLCVAGQRRAPRETRRVRRTRGGVTTSVLREPGQRRSRPGALPGWGPAASLLHAAAQRRSRPGEECAP